MSSQGNVQGINTPENLPPAAVGMLFDDFGRLLKSNEKLRGLISNGRNNTLCELSEEILLFVGNPEMPFPCEIGLNLGFPFPVASKPVTPDLAELVPNYCRVFLRGPKIRNVQREALRKRMLNDHGAKWREIDGLEFKKTVADLLGSNKGKHLLYVDPYNNPGGTLMGNSFIGLDFLDAFLIAMAPERTTIISNSSSHLSFFYRSVPKQTADFAGEFKNSDLVLIMDAVDNRWGHTAELIALAASVGKPVLVLGRNLIVLPGEATQIFHLRGDDPLLACTSVDEYMQGCLTPFLDNASRTQRAWPHRGENIFLNPFSSTPVRDIPPELALALCRRLGSILTSPKIYISPGTPSAKKDEAWLESFRQILPELDQTRCRVEFMPGTQSLNDLGKQLEGLSIGAAITPDTSLAHFFSYMGLPHVTICRMRFWDLSSVQSVSTVFLRDRDPHFPSLLFEEDLRDTNAYAEMVAQGIKQLVSVSGNLSDEEENILGETQRILSDMLSRMSAGTLTEDYAAKCEMKFRQLKERLSGSKENAVFCKLMEEERLLAYCRGKERSYMLTRFPWGISPWIKWLKFRKSRTA